MNLFFFFLTRLEELAFPFYFLLCQCNKVVSCANLCFFFKSKLLVQLITFPNSRHSLQVLLFSAGFCTLYWFRFCGDLNHSVSSYEISPIESWPRTDGGINSKKSALWATLFSGRQPSPWSQGSVPPPGPRISRHSLGSIERGSGLRFQPCGRKILFPPCLSPVIWSRCLLEAACNSTFLRPLIISFYLHTPVPSCPRVEINNPNLYRAS